MFRFLFEYSHFALAQLIESCVRAMMYEIPTRTLIGANVKSLLADELFSHSLKAQARKVTNSTPIATTLMYLARVFRLFLDILDNCVSRNFRLVSEEWGALRTSYSLFPLFWSFVLWISYQFFLQQQLHQSIARQLLT